MFAGLLECNVPEIGRTWASPPIEPFYDGDSFGLEIRVESAGDNLIIIFQPIKIQMFQLESDLSIH